MLKPTLRPTTAQSESFAGYTYHLDGELVPTLTVELSQGQSIYFEHHILLWKHTSINISIRQMKGAMKRMIAGMQIFVTEAGGNGQISFSRDGVGHIFGIHMKQGEELHVREHQFLAATNNIDYTFERVKGVANMLFGGTGFFIDKFHGAQGEGILWLHGYGNVFEVVLGQGEQIDVEPGLALQRSICSNGNQYPKIIYGFAGKYEHHLQPFHRSRQIGNPIHVSPHAIGRVIQFGKIITNREFIPNGHSCLGV